MEEKYTPRRAKILEIGSFSRFYYEFLGFCYEFLSFFMSFCVLGCYEFLPFCSKNKPAWHEQCFITHTK